jgi:hypothetical protein
MELVCFSTALKISTLTSFPPTSPHSLRSGHVYKIELYFVIHTGHLVLSGGRDAGH